MRKWWKSTLIGSALVLALALTGVSALRDTGLRVAEAAVEWAQIEINDNDTYEFGTQLTVPERIVTVGEVSAKAAATLEFPDGSATTLSSVKLDMGGKYTLRYTATVNGKPFVDEIVFTVIDPLYTFDTDKSSAIYGKYDSVAAGADEAVTASGLLVSLAKDDKITFHGLIDVSKLGKNDVLAECFVTPAKSGKADFTHLVYTFTDAFDPDVYLRVSARQSMDGDDFPYTYFLAGGNGQVMAGYEAGQSKLHINNEWGTFTYHCFAGKLGDVEAVTKGNLKMNTKLAGSIDKYPMSLRYDASEVAMYAGSEMIIDFDDPKFFATLWKGFPSGYARLSISADEYTGNNPAAFCVTEVFGLDLQNTVLETDAPELTVDCDYDVMPEAKVGGTYPVPAAAAFDKYSGNSNVRASVYYNYVSQNAVNLPIVNGRFATELAGTYAIVYETTNIKGKPAKKILWVHAGNPIADLTVSSAQANKTVSATLGEWIELEDITVSGGSGDIEVKAVVEFGGETYELKDGFRPEKTGTYTVTVTATDFIGSDKSFEFTVNAKPGNKPVFVDGPMLPAYFIGGGTYTVPELYANDYSSGVCVRKLATAEIEGKSYNAGETFVPEAETNGDDTVITFKCENASLEARVKTIKAFVREGKPERDRLHVENYLVGDGTDYEKKQDSITVTAARADGRWTFANELVAENFDLEFMGIKDKSGFEGLDVYLTDTANKEVQVLVSIRNTGKKASILAGGMKVNVDYGFVTGGTFNISYASKAIIIGMSEIEITECVNGKPFNGFPSGKIMLSVAFDGAVPGHAAYDLSKVNGQPMNNATSDRISPKISVLSRGYGGCVSIGDVKTIPAAIAGDVLDPFVKFSLTVTAPDGTVAKDENGNSLENIDPTAEHTVKCDMYGRYNVTYTAVDNFNGVPNVWSYDLIVEDETAPEIVLSGRAVESATTGDYIAIPDFTVSDNITAAENIRVHKHVLSPSGELLAIPDDSNSIRCTQTGVYEFRITAIDEAGNVSIKRLSVTVSEAAA